MDEKKFKCFSKGMRVLVEWTEKKFSVDIVNANVVLGDDVSGKVLAEADTAEASA